MSSNYTGRINPYDDDIERWAYDEQAAKQGQSHDISVTNVIGWELLAKICSDTSCAKRSFFINFAYYIVGETIHFTSTPYEEKYIVDLLSKLAASELDDIQTFVREASELLQNPDSFEFDYWCGGVH